MQPIDQNKLIENREKLLAWQRQQWGRNDNGLRLHLGCGHVHLDGYVNIDKYTPEADRQEDIRELPSVKPGSVVEIVCQHVLEHLPQRDVWPTLQRWFELLAAGGTIEIGLPDIELCFQAFLEAPEREKWKRFVWTIYGGQTENGVFGVDEWSPRDGRPFCPGQVHQGGFTLGYMVRMLEDIGYRIIDAYLYDGYGTPSFFVYAKKPAQPKTGNILEKDIAIGTFTHRSDYLPALWASARLHLPHIPFVTRFQRGPINAGMSLLREDFLTTGKRYWVFLDDDIQFLNFEIIRRAVANMIAGKFACMSVYSTFDPASITRPYAELTAGLACRETKWATGYFIMVDSRMVGHLEPDMGLPDGNTAVDTSYSVAIRAEGYKIGISPDVVYHTKKEVWARPEVIELTNNYLRQKWGNFYFEVAAYDGNVIDAGWQL